MTSPSPRGHLLIAPCEPLYSIEWPMPLSGTNGSKSSAPQRPVVDRPLGCPLSWPSVWQRSVGPSASPPGKAPALTLQHQGL